MSVDLNSDEESFTWNGDDLSISSELKFSQLPLEDRDEHLTEEEMVGNGSLYMCDGGLFFATYDKNGNFVNNISIDR